MSEWPRRVPLLAVLLVPHLVAAQTSTLVVDGDVGNRLALSADDVRSMAHQRVEVEDQGARSTYDGVPLTAFLARAGVSVGKEPLHGRALVSVVVVTAVDGYQVVFTLAELDADAADSKNRIVILADARDGRPLSASEGPLRVIAPGDRHASRWVRQVVRLSVVAVTTPKQ